MVKVGARLGTLVVWGGAAVLGCHMPWAGGGMAGGGTAGGVTAGSGTAAIGATAVPVAVMPAPAVGVAPGAPGASGAPVATSGADMGPRGGDSPGPPAAAPLVITVIERDFIALINRERESRGIAALTPDDRLTLAARGHSKEMCDLAYFDHRSPTPGLHTPMDRFLRALADSGMAQTTDLLLGENIYHISEVNHVYNVEFGHRAIMNSPSHRAAILEPRFARVGVGAYQDARGELWATEMFLREAPW